MVGGDLIRVCSLREMMIMLMMLMMMMMIIIIVTTTTSMPLLALFPCLRRL